MNNLNVKLMDAFAKLLLDLSFSEENVELMLNTGIDPLLVAASDILDSWIDDELGYEELAGKHNSPEYFLAQLVNITATKTGRYHFVTSVVAQHFTLALVKLLSIKTDVTSRIKYLALSLLYNISINRSGHRLLLQNECFTDMIVRTLQSGNLSFLETDSVLRLLESVCHEKQNGMTKFVERIKEKLNFSFSDIYENPEILDQIKKIQDLLSC